MIRSIAAVYAARFGLFLRALLVLPIVALARLVSPFAIIRFGRLESTGLGHFAANTELYLCERDAGLNVPPRRHVDLFFLDRFVCNQQLAIMWKRTLRVLPLSLWPIEQLLRRIPGGRVHLVPTEHSDRDIYGLMPSTPPHLHFTDDEERAGQDGLAKLGIPAGAEFICFHSRDDAYLHSLRPLYTNWDYSYHDHRNTTIENYLPAANALAARGHYVVRMGAVVAKPLAAGHPRVVDYASSGHRSDFLDIYLSAKCRFFLSSASGIDAVPKIFRRPTMSVNYLPFEYVHCADPTTLFIPKKHWLKDEQRWMTFREILESGAGRFIRRSGFERLGIELIENSADEIRDIALEMDDRLAGRWVGEPEDEQLQRRFRALFQVNDINGEFRAFIGAKFLRDYRECLGPG